MQAAITAAKLKAQAPHVLLRPEVAAFGALDFFKLGRILRAAEPAREELKRRLGTLLEPSRRGAVPRPRSPRRAKAKPR